MGPTWANLVSYPLAVPSLDNRPSLFIFRFFTLPCKQKIRSFTLSPFAVSQLVPRSRPLTAKQKERQRQFLEGGGDQALGAMPLDLEMDDLVIIHSYLTSLCSIYWIVNNLSLCCNSTVPQMAEQATQAQKVLGWIPDWIQWDWSSK